MAQGAGSPARQVTVLARLAVALLIAGLAVQAGFMVREAHDQLSTPVRHPLRDFLERADAIIPAGAGYVVTSPVRSDDARYFLYPRRQIATAFDRASLERSGTRYVIETSDARLFVGGGLTEATKQNGYYDTVFVDPDTGQVTTIIPAGVTPIYNRYWKVEADASLAANAVIISVRVESLQPSVGRKAEETTLATERSW